MDAVAAASMLGPESTLLVVTTIEVFVIIGINCIIMIILVIIATTTTTAATTSTTTTQ